MLEIWEFVLILVGAEAFVGIIAGIFIWRKQSNKNEENTSQKDLLEELPDDINLEDLYEADDLEIGIPPNNYQHSNGDLELKSFRRLSSVSDFREPVSSDYTARRTSILSNVALPDFDPCPAPMIMAASNDIYYDRPAIDARPPSYHTRLSFTQSHVGDELTPVNTPSPSRSRKPLAVRDSSTRGLSRPKMGDPTPFSFFSEKSNASTLSVESFKTTSDDVNQQTAEIQTK